jgi:hypothetical protein
MSNKPFALRVVLGQTRDYGLSLYRMPAGGENVNGSGHDWRQVVGIHGTPMRAVMDQVLAAIKQAGYRPADLSRGRTAPFLLSEELGVRLGLLMLAVKPLRKSSRMTDISEQIQSMASEEAYYWFSKMTDHHLGRRSQKAMRILLAKE